MIMIAIAATLACVAFVGAIVAAIVASIRETQSEERDFRAILKITEDMKRM